MSERKKNGRAWPAWPLALFMLYCMMVAVPASGSERREEPPATSIRTQKASYAVYESIVVEYGGFPGTKWDWITIVEQTAPPATHGNFMYTGAGQSGSLAFPGLPEGWYEARAFHNRPDGIYRLRASHAFKVAKQPNRVVKDRNHLAWTMKDIYKAEELIIVEFNNMPGNKQDWITVVPSNSPPEHYRQWYYLDGRKNGTVTFKGLTPGQYEVRVYFNWPEDAYRVRDRYGFSVK